MNNLLKLIQNHKGLLNGNHIFEILEDIPDEIQDLEYKENIVPKIITDDVIVLICGDDSEPATEVTFKITDGGNLELVGHKKLDDDEEDA